MPEVEHFAIELESRIWNFGECDNDVVIVYSAGDNVVSSGFNQSYIMNYNLLTSILSLLCLVFRKIWRLYFTVREQNHFIVHAMYVNLIKIRC